MEIYVKDLYGTEYVMVLLIRFNVRGNFRYLSHAETVRLFQRACVRAGIKLVYSKGFNPRPNLSLPLPRSVGVESDDELLCLRVENSESSFDSERFQGRLCSQLPEGIELLSVDISKARRCNEATEATYIFSVRKEYLNDGLKKKIKSLLDNESLSLQRRVDAQGRIRDIDVRPFLKSIELEQTDIVVECNITSTGSIRVDEILRLLELDIEKLTSPIRRRRVKWQL